MKLNEVYVEQITSSLTRTAVISLSKNRSETSRKRKKYLK